MYSGGRLWVGDDQADVGGGVGGWMDRWVAEGWTEVGVSSFSLRKMPSPTQPF